MPVREFHQHIFDLLRRLHRDLGHLAVDYGNYKASEPINEYQIFISIFSNTLLIFL